MERTGVEDKFHAEALERLPEVAGGQESVALAIREDQERDTGVRGLAALGHNSLRQAAEFLEGEVGTAEDDRVERLARADHCQFPARGVEFLRADGDRLFGRAPAQRCRQRGCLGRQAHGVEHRHPARGCRRGAEGLQIVGARPAGQPLDDRNPLPYPEADDVAEQREERGVGIQPLREPHDHGRPAILGEVKPPARDPPRERGTDVHEIAVPIGARAQDGVGEDDRVRLPPGQLLAEAGREVTLVGGTRPGRHAPERQVGIHQPRGPRRVVLAHSEPLPIGLVERRGIQRGRHDHSSTQSHEPLDELEARRAEDGACINVGLLDGQEFFGLADLGHAHDDRHGQAHGLAVPALQHRALFAAQAQAHHWPPVRLA